MISYEFGLSAKSQARILYLPCGREVVLWDIEDLWLEDLSCLLGNPLSQEVVVHLDTWDVAAVAWDDGSLPCCWALSKQSRVIIFNS